MAKTRTATVTESSGPKGLNIQFLNGVFTVEYYWEGVTGRISFTDGERITGLTQLAADLGVAEGTLQSLLTAALAASQVRLGYV